MVMGRNISDDIWDHHCSVHNTSPHYRDVTTASGGCVMYFWKARVAARGRGGRRSQLQRNCSKIECSMVAGTSHLLTVLVKFFMCGSYLCKEIHVEIYLTS